MSKICTVCHEEKIASPDRKISEFSIQSVSPTKGTIYYVSKCKTCINQRNKSLYRPVPVKQKPGKPSIVETNVQLKRQIEQMLFDGHSAVAIAARTGVPLSTIRTQKKKGFLVPDDHTSEEDETESDTSEDNESIAVEPDISDDE